MPDRHPIVDLEATCACGAVHVAVRGRIGSMLFCSCEHCQKATGAGHAAFASAEIGDVSIDGATASFAQTANSGATLTRQFCPRCGTPIAGFSSRAPGILMLPVGLFGAETDWFAPSQLIFARSHHDWDWLPESLPHYRTYRNEEHG